MRKRLILIRHAKSGWDDPFMDDHERVLTNRGRKASTAIGTWLKQNNYLPDITLVSDAARTVETSKLLQAALGHDSEIKFMPSLYHASPDTILDIAQRRPEATIAVIAHNPGIGMLAHALVKQRPDHHRFSDYPTAATTVVDFGDNIRLGQGRCVDFIVPRDLD